MGRKSDKVSARSLTAGRPITVGNRRSADVNKKSSQTRSQIRAFHQLRKAYATAVATNDEASTKSLESRMDAFGGLEAYQLASLAGQSIPRGGDSTRKLIELLERHIGSLKQLRDIEDLSGTGLRCLDIGALSTDTALSKTSLFEMTRIDLNSQSSEIMQQDFMERPLPCSDKEKFHLICLSLVLNFVPKPDLRGEMLMRTRAFLLPPKSCEKHDESYSVERKILPALWIVLPAPCVSNSRYLDESRLRDIMESLGFALVQIVVTAKVFYSLWTFAEDVQPLQKEYPKVVVREGSSRNNFSIVLNKEK